MVMPESSPVAVCSDAVTFDPWTLKPDLSRLDQSRLHDALFQFYPVPIDTELLSENQPKLSLDLPRLGPVDFSLPSSPCLSSSASTTDSSPNAADAPEQEWLDHDKAAVRGGKAWYEDHRVAFEAWNPSTLDHVQQPKDQTPSAAEKLLNITSTSSSAGLISYHLPHDGAIQNLSELAEDSGLAWFPARKAYDTASLAVRDLALGLDSEAVSITHRPPYYVLNPKSLTFANRHSRIDHALRRAAGLGHGIRELRRFVGNKTTVAHSSDSGIALADVIRRTIARVEHSVLLDDAESLANDVDALHEALARLSKLVQCQCDLKQQIESIEEDYHVLEKAFAWAHEQTHVHPDLTPFVNGVLDHVLHPWLAAVESCVGSEPHYHVSQTIRRLLPRAIDKSEPGALGFSTSPQNWPAFVNDDDAHLITDTIKANRLVDSLCSNTPKCPSSATRLVHDPAPLRLGQGTETQLSHAGSTMINFDPFDTDKTALASKIELARKDLVCSQHAPNSSSDALTTCIDHYLLPDRSAKDTLRVNSIEDALYSVRPTIEAHLRECNRRLIKKLFEPGHGLVHGLKRLHEFSLMSSGVFVGAVRARIFSTQVEEQSERQRRQQSSSLTAKGSRNQGLRPGLGFGNRQIQPSNCFNARLELAGLLADADATSFPQDADGSRIETSFELSFGVRSDDSILRVSSQRPSDEANTNQGASIAQILHPHSLFALDFLQITPRFTRNSLLEHVITPTCIDLYDSIFATLFRVQRLLFVVDELSAAQRRLRRSEGLGFVIEAGTFVSCIASHFRLMIDAKMQGFTSRVCAIAQAFDSVTAREDQTMCSDRFTELDVEDISPQQLAKMHEEALDSVLASLLLRPRQKLVREALETALQSVLDGAIQFQRDASNHRLADGACTDGTGYNSQGMSKQSVHTAETARNSLEQLRRNIRALMTTCVKIRDTDSNQLDADGAATLVERLELGWGDQWMSLNQS